MINMERIMKKYLIDEKVVFAHNTLNTYIIERYKYKEKEVKVCWYSGNIELGELYAPIYFELRNDLKGYFDYSILKRETLEVVEFITERFNIRKDLIRIYFNGKDGFYIVIPGIVTGLFRLKNINEELKKLAEYVKESINVENIRTDIYELDSYHIEFNTENKSTNLYLVNLSKEMVNKFTYKELVKYASYKREDRFFGRVDYRATEIEPSLLEVIDNHSEKRLINQWLDGYIPTESGINKESVKKFYRECETIEEYIGLVDEAREFYNHMRLQSNRFKESEKETFFKDVNYDLIIMLLNYLYIKNSKYQLYKLEEESVVKEHVLCDINGKNNAELILYFNSFIMGNEDINIYMGNDLGKKSFEEVIEIAATLYIYLKNNY